MTYQLALAGRDGLVLASDRCERHANELYGAKNMVRKIWTDHTAQFAWACSGSEAAPFFADQILKGIAALGETFSEDMALKALEESSQRFVQEYLPNARGPWPCSILFVCGPAKRILRRKHIPPTPEMLEGLCVAGMEFNLAAFLPCRFYTRSMSVDELIGLAAYSVREAHNLESAMVDGLDIAVYRDSTHRFEFVDSDFHWNEAEKLHEGINKLLQRPS